MYHLTSHKFLEVTRLYESNILYTNIANSAVMHLTLREEESQIEFVLHALPQLP
jgi:hypothetical protein